MTSEIRANTIKNRVGLGTVSYTNTGIVVSGIVTANSFSGTLTSNGDITGTGDLTLTSTDAGSSAAPIINLFRNSASPADADYLGQIKFQGESDTGVQRNYAKITGKILDASNGTEDGILEFAHIKAGSQNISARFRSDSLQLLNDTNLSVAGDTTLTGDLDVDGHTNLDNISIAGINTIGAVNQTVYSPHASNWATSSAITLLGNYGGGLAFNDNNNNGWVQYVSGSGVDFWLQNGAVGGSLATSLKATKGGSVELYHNGTKRFQTSSVGADVTGNFGASGNISLSGSFQMPDALQHMNDATTQIRFPTTGTFTVETAGSERLRITSGGKILGGNLLNDRGALLQIEHSSHNQIGVHRNANNHGAPAITMSSSRGTSAGSNTIVQSGDYLGMINFSGTDGSDLASGAFITGIVDGTPGNNDMPTRLGFWTSPVGSETPVERLRIHSDYLVTVGNNNISSLTQPSKLRIHGSYVNAVGPFGILEFKNRDNSGEAVCSIRGVRDAVAGGNYSAGLAFHTNNANPASASDGDYERLRIDSNGTATLKNTGAATARSDFLGSLRPISQIASTWNAYHSLTRHDAGSSYGPYLMLAKNRNDAYNSNGIVQDNDELGNIAFQGNDGSVFREGARIRGEVDGTPGSNQMPGALSFWTNNGSGMAERLRIKAGGDMSLGSGATVAGLRYLDVQNASSAASNHGSILRLITSNAAGNGTTSVDMVKYKDGNFYINNNETSGSTNFNTGGSTRLNISATGQVTKPYQYFFTVETSGHAKSANWSQITGLTPRASQCTGVSNGTNWSNSTDRFTAPVAGVYYFYCGGWAVSAANGSRYAYTFKHQNGNHYDFIGGGNYCLVDSPMDGFSKAIKLSAGEWVELWGYSSVATTWGGGHRFFWGGYLLG